MTKNELYTAVIESLSSDGSGVCHIEGMAVFVPFTSPLDKAVVRIVKLKKTFAYGIVEKLLEPSPLRTENTCPAFGKCGGCALRHLSYEEEKRQKLGFVNSAFAHIGGLEIRAHSILSADNPDRYRNKVQFPVFGPPLSFGLYAPRSHRPVNCSDCLLQPELLNRIAAKSCAILEKLGVRAYDETARTGSLRHILIRASCDCSAVLVALVSATPLACAQIYAQQIREAFPEIETVTVNLNPEATNVILGRRTEVVAGRGYIEDTLCGVPVKIDTYSFYQVNHSAAELLYSEVARMADLTGSETVLDLYCGAGTIGLSLAGGFKKLIGAEIVPSAVAGAISAAEQMGISDKTEFIASDAGAAALVIAGRKEKIDVAITDPPRSGCSPETIAALIDIAPKRIVMVSCNAATAARDVRALQDAGYTPTDAIAVDMFPRSMHVETVVLMSRVEK